jgi:hypothetical protein
MKVMFIGDLQMYNSVNKYPTKGKWYNYIEYVKVVKPLSKNYYVIKNDGNNLNDLMELPR